MACVGFSKQPVFVDLATVATQALIPGIQRALSRLSLFFLCFSMCYLLSALLFPLPPSPVHDDACGHVYPRTQGIIFFHDQHSHMVESGTRFIPCHTQAACVTLGKVEASPSFHPGPIESRLVLFV